MQRSDFKILSLTAVLILTMLSCGAKSRDSIYSAYGFYYPAEETIRTLEPKQKLSSEEHFILANAYKEKNELKKAAVHFANSAFLSKRSRALKPFPSPVYNFLDSWSIKSDYYEDAAMEIASIFFKYNEFIYSAKFASLVSDKDISLYRDAIVLRARSLEQLKRYDEAIYLLNESISKFKSTELTPVLHIRIASIYQKKENFQRSMDSYMSSLKITSDGWQGATAAKEAYGLIKNNKVTPPKNSIPLVRGLISAKEFESARKVLDTDKSSGFDHDLVFITVCAYIGKINEAEHVISKYEENSSERAELLSALSDTLWNKGKKREAAETLKRLVAIQKSDTRDELKRLCYYLYDNNSAEASAYMSLFAQKYPNDRLADKMLWLAAKPFIEKKDFASARGFLDTILSKFPKSEYSGNARFWIYKILSSEKKIADAEAIFRNMPVFSPGSAYTWILMNRKKDEYSERDLITQFDSGISTGNSIDALFAHAMLYLKTGNKAEKSSRIKKLSSSGLNPYESFNDLIHNGKIGSNQSEILSLTKKYYAAGHSEGISRILNSIVIPADEPILKNEYLKNKALMLSQFGKKYGNFYHQATGTSDLLQAMDLQENLFLMSDEAVDRLLPHGFSADVENAARSFDVSKPVIRAIIKTESMFNHKAVSGVGATGLMQLMPPTAGDISKALKIRNYDMKNPSDSINFGTYYIAWLNRFFKNNFRYAVAGYNAGAGNIIKWKQQYNPVDIDLFTEQIPFDETRLYVISSEKYVIQYSLLENQ